MRVRSLGSQSTERCFIEWPLSAAETTDDTDALMQRKELAEMTVQHSQRKNSLYLLTDRNVELTHALLCNKVGFGSLIKS
jgi:hypothetical protein